jgi:hypothetical protein
MCGRRYAATSGRPPNPRVSHRATTGGGRISELRTAERHCKEPVFEWHACTEPASMILFGRKTDVHKTSLAASGLADNVVRAKFRYSEVPH